MINPMEKSKTVDVFGYIHEDQRDFFQGMNTFTLDPMKADDRRVCNITFQKNFAKHQTQLFLSSAPSH